MSDTIDTKFKTYLNWANENYASDIHFSVGHPPIFRISGDLHKLDSESELTEKSLQQIAKIMLTDDLLEILEKQRSVDFSYSFENNIRFRGNIYYQLGKLACSLRLIPNKIRDLDELKMPPVLHSFTQRKQGFVLITGPANQGKSTTLAAMIDEINHERGEHIITIEDPIEYIFSDDKCVIDQREIGRDAESFQGALRASLRQDPDVIMVGEMRDLETMSIALTAAETGHLVFATLHTNSAAQTINRIVDSFPAEQQNQIRSQLSHTLLGVISQRLVPLKEGGLASACEVMLNNTAVANLIREGKIYEIPNIIETSSNSGMISLNRALAKLVKEGKVDIETAVNYSTNPKGLRDLTKFSL